nr:eukaryotic translation initiation factor 3 subunit D-like [Tanacetum cinerariifolium]
DGGKVSFDEVNPFASEGEEVASVGYKYRRWKLNNDTSLVVRCEVQSYIDVNAKKSFLTLNALNEFDPKYSGVDWRRKLLTQRGAVLETDLKNNANKIAKIYEVPTDAFENDYVEEPLPEDEQVQPPAENGDVVDENMAKDEVEGKEVKPEA